MSDKPHTTVEREPPVCSFCKKRRLWTEDEKELRICGHCADRQYERYQEQAEWNYYHHD